MSMVSTSPNYFAIGTFTVVNSNPIVLPVEIIFTFEVKYASWSSWTQNYVFVIESCRIVSTCSSVIINNSIACSICCMPTARTWHNNIVGAIDGYRSRPSASLRWVTHKYDSHHRTCRSHSTRTTKTIITSDKGHRSTFAVVNLNIVVGIVVRKDTATVDHCKVEQYLCFGVGRAEHLTCVLQVSICAVDCIAVATT